ncbi:relaxase [Pseudomonas sp. FSL R10-0056]|uniref:MobH family relaxase n=1 Tax=unclassified Pseudomonas TaxID=196821 RepID=UPI00129728FD|nr:MULTISPECIES: MobH family relaxase [unclassified Pseudomonas]MDN5391555.1 TraI domain-containing protein [Pseudomonas sp.]MDN5453872.1 TraI domain-containing protein [Pseudomonas sp.]MDN5457917.1 TraI domain-containing protein [Pseudomonas sp.]MDN5496569.1 TraI domain-containing protein [Pseudomonas sp.]MDN5671297.1 TraI domain-containing protein [Pseudomonas sp.]
MLSLFRRSKTLPDQAPPPNGFLQPACGQTLLDTPRRQKMLEHIWQRASLSRAQFERLYRHPIARYAELVQLLPASQNHHHAHLGGMLDHGLEIVAYALKIRQTYLLPIGAPPESQSAQAEAWTAAAAYAALIHDLGKIIVDVHIELEDGQIWHPWHGPIKRAYRFRYVDGRNYQLHGAAAALIYTQVLTPDILDWLIGFSELWAQLIFILAGHYEHAGILGEIVVKADQASVAQALGGNPLRALSAPKQSLQRQLADGLRYLVRDTLRLNQADGPADGWLTHDALWLVSKPIADQLRAYLLTQGVEGIPSSNATFFNMLQDQGVIQTNAQDKAIWKATIDNGRGWRNTFTLLRLSPALIWTDANDRPAAYSGTVQVESGTSADDTQSDAQSLPPSSQQSPPFVSATPFVATVNVPFEHLPPTASDPAEVEALMALLDDIKTPLDSHPVTSPIEPEPTHANAGNEPLSETLAETPRQKTELGQGFVDWLKEGIAARRIIINDTKALVHTVAGTAMLVTPGIFKRFVLEFPALEAQAKAQELNAWQLVQRSFEKLKLHRKTAKSLNIWTCNVVGPRSTKKLRGYLLQDPLTVFNEVPFDNVSLSLVVESAEGSK